MAEQDMTSFFDEDSFSREQERAKSSRSRGDSILPAADFSPGLRDRIKSAVTGLGAGVQAAGQAQDPLTAALAGFSGALAGSPDPQVLATQRAMAQVSATPIGSVSPQIAEFLEASGIPGAASMPFAQVQQFMPLIESANQFQQIQATIGQRGAFSAQQSKDMATFLEISEERAAALGRLPQNIRAVALQTKESQNRLAQEAQSRFQRESRLTQEGRVKRIATIEKILADFKSFALDDDEKEAMKEDLRVLRMEEMMHRRSRGVAAPEPERPRAAPQVQQAAGPVTMVRPDGKSVNVHPAQVQAAEQAGYKRAK